MTELTQEILNEKYAALPEFSRKVYDALIDGLYAEPHFTDVTGKDLANKTGEKVEAVNAAIGHLYQADLAYYVDMDDSGTFIGAHAHDLELVHPGAK